MDIGHPVVNALTKCHQLRQSTVAILVCVPFVIFSTSFVSMNSSFTIIAVVICVYYEGIPCEDKVYS